MRFFTYDGERSSSALWTWRSTTVVMVLALVSSLAVGLGAAGGLSVLEQPGTTGSASPPLADTRPPVPLPLDPDPPPAPNTADAAEPEPPRDTEPETDHPGTGDVRQPESGPTEPVPEVDGEVDDTVEGTWTTVDESVDGTWNAVGGTFDSVAATEVFGWSESHCPEAYQPPSGQSQTPSWDSQAHGDSDWDGAKPSETDRYPSWDTEYPVHGGHER